MQKKWNAIDPMLRKIDHWRGHLRNRGPTNTAKTDRKDPKTAAENSENTPTNQPKEAQNDKPKHGPKAKLETLSLACKVSAVVINHPGHRAMSSSDKTDPNASRIPQKQSPKNRRTRKPKEKPRKQAKQATKSAKGKQTKTNENPHQTRKQDRIASLKSRKNSVLQAPIQTTGSRN